MLVLVEEALLAELRHRQQTPEGRTKLRERVAVEYTFDLAADALGKDEPDGLPLPELQAICDQLLEASVPVPELVRRAAVSSCGHDPVRVFAPVLTAMPAHGIPLGDILDDSGHSHRDRRLGTAAAGRRRPGRAGRRRRNGEAVGIGGKGIGVGVARRVTCDPGPP